MDHFDAEADAELEALSNVELRDSYIRVGMFAEAAAMCKDMDTISASILSGDAALYLAAYLPHTLILERDGSIWNVVDIELVAFEAVDAPRCERCGPLACSMNRHRKAVAST